MSEKFYMTTAIAYASKKPHFGNTYEAIMTDAMARYRREMGYDVFMCTGTDEHGQKIEDLATEAGITPKAYVDRVAGEIKSLWDEMNVKYDHFIRTTDDYHETAVKKMFTRFYNQGDIYKSRYEGWYCVPCESFFTDTQAVDCKCPDCGREVQRASEEAYFFNMKKYADRLMEYIEAHPEFIEPESRKKEIVNNFLKAGLQDLCVSRTSFTWGIPVEIDPKHVTYVWLDALTNYITALGYDPDKSFDEQSEKFKKYWPADVHIIGKDIIRFHTIYWPIFLMALDLPLPKKEVNGFTTLINPQKPIPKDIQDITGINDEMVADKPLFDAIIGDFYKYIDGAVLIAHNANFDVNFIKKSAEREGYYVENDYLDTMEIARKNILGLKNYKLNTICEHFGIQFLHHRAMSDAHATAKMFLEIIKLKKCLPN